MTERDPIPTQLRSSRPWIKNLLLLAVVLVIAATVYWQFRESLSVDYLASQESQLRQWQVDFPLLAAIAGVAIYVAVAGLSLPGAAVLTLAYGWYFG
ncbi:MAG TPA: TVP38/TMEM64 family protein, partial [Pirellula sp.]|nr:TVP38/TMEM64 family protein [Pirellula sp.]